MSASLDVAVIGAGPWGLATAWRAAADGARVALLDDGGPAAGWAAAGMLGPWSEAADGEDAVRALLVRAAAAWPGFADDLAAASDRDLGFARSETLLVASRPEHVADVRRHRERLAALGQDLPWLTGSALRAREPGLGTGVAGGMAPADEHQVDPRRLLPALRAACARAGVEMAAGAAGLLRDGRRGQRVVGAVTGAGARIMAARVVLAAGWAAGRLAGRVPLRPVKGQILRLATPPGAPAPITRVVRARSVYLVPRASGEVVVGASVEERGDRVVTAGAVHELLDEAIHLVPDLGELELAEVHAALRPVTPDGAPALGLDPDDGLLWAVGGHRHGILLAPVVAEALAALAADRPAPPDLAPVAPTRFPAPVASSQGALACA